MYIDAIGLFSVFFFFQAEDGIRDLVRSRGLGDVYKRQAVGFKQGTKIVIRNQTALPEILFSFAGHKHLHNACLLYTSDAADERSSVDLGGRRIIKKKKNNKQTTTSLHYHTHTPQ